MTSPGHETFILGSHHLFSRQFPITDRYSMFFEPQIIMHQEP